MEPTQSAPQMSQIATQSSSTSAKKDFNPWIITTILLVVFVIVSVIVLFYYHPWKSTDINTEYEQATNDGEDEEENGAPDNDGDDSNDDTNNDAPDFDMTAEWNTYTSATYNFSLKFPKGLTYTENGTLASGGFSAEFTSGGTTSVFTAWMVSADSGTSSQTVAELRISNMCTDSIAYSTYTPGDYAFTRATEIPDESCLSAFGIVRDIPLEAFVWKIDPTTFFVLVNEGLNAEQLEAVLVSITF